MAASIFISYRRQDAIAHSRAVFERLRSELRDEHEVFIDLEGNAYGEDFVESLERQLAGCRVMLVLVGPQWLGAQDAKGRRRIDNGADFVRLEVRAALARSGLRVLPLLIDGTEMPTEGDLPADLHPLLRRHAMNLRFASFDADMRHLVEQLRRMLSVSAPSVAAPAEAAPAAAAPEAAVPAATSPEVAVPVAAAPTASKVVVPSFAAAPPAVVRFAAAPPAAVPPAASPPTAARPAVRPVPGAPAVAAEALQQTCPAWARADGRDEFGRWAEFSVGDVVQRLRWIEPGEFLMGSPKGEFLRSYEEGPQHRVHISQGFWLADTACTQALWLAVVGGPNPARFVDDPQNPVEMVSDEDIELFLAALAGKLGHGADLVLPTEAQWEYACRAGTSTAFSFGATITPEQANYDGNFPYAGAAEGLYRNRTLPVKALPANAWGLHQMHGSVWEWCADGLRKYAEVPAGKAAKDPTGPQEQGPAAHRAVRGGSWMRGAGDLRSAYRGRYQRLRRDADLGFRLALRS